MKDVFMISRDNRGIEFLLRAFAKLRKATISFVVLVCSSVLPSIRVEQPGVPLDGFPRNFIFEYFSKICRENSNVIQSDKIYAYFS